MRPLRYKGIVVGMKVFANELRKEIERVRRLGLQNRRNIADPEKNSRPGVWHDHVDDPDVNPYEVRLVCFVQNIPRKNSPCLSRQSRFGEDWMDHLPAKFNFVSVQVLIDHAIDEGNRLFADTRFATTWCFYHDALAQWWEKGEGGAQ